LYICLIYIVYAAFPGKLINPSNMKKSLTFAVLTVFLTFSVLYSAGQTYHSFIKNGAFWKGYHNPPFASTYCYSNSLYPDGLMKYTINGDTVVNNKTYFKVYRQVIGNTSTLPCTYSEPLNYRGALRDDSLNKRVYFLPPNHLQDTLLFHTNLNIGDTLKDCYGFSANNSNFVVNYIDSVLLLNSYRKYFILFNPNSMNCIMTFLYEGIGSDCIFLNDEPQNPQSIFCVGYESVDSTSFPAVGQEHWAGILVGKPEKVNTLASAVRIYPNPVRDKLNIAISSEEFLPVQLSIYDIRGRLIQPVLTLRNTETILNTLSFKPGLYYFKVENQDHSFVKGEVIILQK